MVYMFASLLAVLVLPSEFNAPFHFAFQHLLIPGLFLGYAIAWWLMPRWWRSTGLILRAFYPGLVAGSLVLFSAGPILVVNRFLPPQEFVEVAGEVVGRYRSGKYGETYVVVVYDSILDRHVELVVDPSTFETLLRGTTYSRCMARGGLGILYEARCRSTNVVPGV